MHTPSSPLVGIRRHSDTYWHAADRAAVLRWLASRSDLHDWRVAAADERRHTEQTRFYHKPPGADWVEKSGLVVERARNGGAWLRLDGSDRVARALGLPLEIEPEPAADLAPVAEQLAMFCEVRR